MNLTMRFMAELLVWLIIYANGFEWPGSCKPGLYYEPGTMECRSCPANASMVTSSDGFACTCEDHSIPMGPGRCKPCNATAVVSADGAACVPRRCQNSSGRIVCRKCPNDYISVTQNFDGSPMKEVLCVKCARGYKAQENVCVRCEACACARNEIIVRGKCISKRYMTERPKHEETRLHPFALLDIVKHEFMCTQNDARACRTLASECVRNFYSTDLAGPCRLWIQPKIVTPKDLPQLTVETTTGDKNPGEISLSRGLSTIAIVVATFSNGGIKILQDPSKKDSICFLPHKIVIGNDFLNDCHMNVSTLHSFYNKTFSPFLFVNGDLSPLPVSIRKPNGENVQKSKWASKDFRRYFFIDDVLSTMTNTTNTVYLRTLLVKVQVQRDKNRAGCLRVRISIGAQFANKSPVSQSIMTTLRIEHEMPSAGILRGLEIWGGVLGALLALYAIAQWRGTVRRGGPHFSLLPLLAGSLADALYFSALFSTLHALAAEAGTLGMTLPLARAEENVIKAFVISAVSIKAVRVVWMNWNQCRCDIFILDWSDYNPPVKDASVVENGGNWRSTMLAREWSRMQSKRRAPPGFTATIALVILHLMEPWQSYLPQSTGYRWAVATLAWWASYVAVLSTRWILDRTLGQPTAALPRICTALGLSLLVFQEEHYAHYVHGRNDDSDARSMSGPLATCRVVCAPQLRAVYKKFSSAGLGAIGESATRQALLSRFFAAFFERALDGLNWVASERTVLERLLDVELVSREAGNTSILLYDPNNGSPSCFMLTWWGEEWSLGTLDAMTFGCVVLTADNSSLAALVTITLWQILKQLRTWFGNKNQREKTDIEIKLH